MEDRIQVLVRLAREIALEIPDFQTPKGAGEGDKATARFLKELRKRVFDAFDCECWEKRICGPTAYAVDFYLEAEATVIEVALGLPNPSTEFEKDILKAIIAQDYTPVKRLVLISRAGGERKCEQPGRAELRKWASTKHSLQIDVFDLGGEPRKRKLRPRKTVKQGE